MNGNHTQQIDGFYPFANMKSLQRKNVFKPNQPARSIKRGDNQIQTNSFQPQRIIIGVPKRTILVEAFE